MKKLYTSLAFCLLFAWFHTDALGQCFGLKLVSSPTEVCDGSSTVLSATWDIGSSCSPATFEWRSMGDSLTTTTINSFTVTPTPLSMYSVILKDSSGNIINTSPPLGIPVNSNPQVTLAPINDMCEGTEVILTANVQSGGMGPFDYTWSDGIGNFQIQQTVNSGQNSFSVTVTDANGCEGTASQTLTGFSKPNPIISDTNPLTCVNSSVEFNACASTPSGSTFSWSPTTWLSDPSICNPSWTPLAEGPLAYTLTVISNGCISTNSLVATAVATPSAIIEGANQTCLGNTISLNSVPGNSGFCSWSPSNFFSQPNECQTNFLSNVAGVGPTEITLTVTLGNCSDTVTKTLMVLDKPNVIANGDNACLGEGALLSACSSTGAGSLTFIWSPPQGFPAPTMTCNPTVTSPVAGQFVYTVTVEDANQCTESSTVNAEFHSPPDATIEVINETICQGGTATLTASPGGVSYLWNTNDMNRIINVSPDMDMTYSVTVTGPNGCTAQGAAQINVIPDPTVTIAGTDVLCSGNTFTLTAKPSGGIGNPTYSWEKSTDGGSTWSGSIGTDVILSEVITQATQFRVKLSLTGAGCNQATSPIKTVTVVTTPAPEIDVIGGMTEVCKNQQVLYFVTNPTKPIGSSTFEWSVPGAPAVMDTSVFGSYILVHWSDNLNAIDSIFVTETIGDLSNQCFGTGSIEVNVGSGAARETAEIIHFKVNNILVAKDSTAKCYQWGYLDPKTGEHKPVPDETFQAYAAGNAYDETREYWVQTWDGNCMTCPTFNFGVVKTVESSMMEEEESRFLLYPDPNNGDFQLDVNRLPKEEYTLLIADVLGRVIEKKTIATPNGKINENINLDKTVSKGLYILVLLDKSAIYKARKFIVQ